MHSSVLVDGLVICSSTDGDFPAAADSPSDHSVVPLPLGVGREQPSIIRINILRNVVLSAEDQHRQDNHLEQSLTHDMLHHIPRNDVLMSTVRLTVQQLFSRCLGSQGQRG